MRTLRRVLLRLFGSWKDFRSCYGIEIVLKYAEYTYNIERSKSSIDGILTSCNDRVQVHENVNMNHALSIATPFSYVPSSNVEGTMQVPSIRYLFLRDQR